MSTILDYWFRSKHPKKDEKKKPEFLIDTENTLANSNSKSNHTVENTYPNAKPYMVKPFAKDTFHFKRAITFNTVMTVGWPFDELQPNDLICVTDFPKDFKEWTLRDTVGNLLTPDESLLLYTGSDLILVARSNINTIKFKVTMSNNNSTFTHYNFDQLYNTEGLSVINNFISYLPKGIHIEAYVDDELIMDSNDPNVYMNHYFTLKSSIDWKHPFH